MMKNVLKQERIFYLILETILLVRDENSDRSRFELGK